MKPEAVLGCGSLFQPMWIRHTAGLQNISHLTEMLSSLSNTLSSLSFRLRMWSTSAGVKYSRSLMLGSRSGNTNGGGGGTALQITGRSIATAVFLGETTACCSCSAVVFFGDGESCLVAAFLGDATVGVSGTLNNQCVSLAESCLSNQ